MALQVDFSVINGSVHARLLACMSPARAFARVLAVDPERADALVHAAIGQALADAGGMCLIGDLKTWLFATMHRNHFGETADTGRHSLRVPLPWDRSQPEATDFDRAFWQLGDLEREVLILVGASGLSRESVAEVCACTTGAVEQRNLQARHHLARLLRRVSGHSGPPLGQPAPVWIGALLTLTPEPESDTSH